MAMGTFQGAYFFYHHGAADDPPDQRGSLPPSESDVTLASFVIWSSVVANGLRFFNIAPGSCIQRARVLKKRSCP
jgi:hypothetical protein